MLKAAIILCLAAAATATTVPHETNFPVQTFRIGYVKPHFVHVKGVIEPSTSTVAKGFPTYNFNHVVDGVPSVESDKYFFRCNGFTNFDGPAFLCRSDEFQKESVADMKIPRMAFILSADDFTVPDGTEFGLFVGHNAWKSIVDPVTTPVGVLREKRQFGGGFSGSGAQAGASSFGGGGGFGGFPGGGFGGGFSGSGAQAGASSFGGGGGGFVG